MKNKLKYQIICFFLSILTLLLPKVASSGSTDSFGLNMHTLGRKPEEMVIWNRVQQAGIKWVRIDVDWPTIQENGPGKFDWSSVDIPVQAALDRGMSIYLSLIRTPAWASSCQPNQGCYEDPTVFPPADYGDWKIFVTKLVYHINAKWGNNPKIKHYGIGNEPNLFTYFKCRVPWPWPPYYIITNCPYKAYQGLLQGAYNKIKAQCSDCKVLAPCTADVGDWDDYVENALSNDKNYIDIITHHIYNDTVTGFWNEFGALKSAINAAGASSKPIWITETGWQTIKQYHTEDDPVLLKEQAAKLELLLGDWLKAQHTTPTLKKLFYYDAINDGRSPEDYRDGSYGLMKSRDHGFAPKPAYYTFKHFLGSLSPFSFQSYLIGDWNGDGSDNVALRTNNCIWKDIDFDSEFDELRCMGQMSAEPDAFYSGDWDGDGIDTVAYRINNCFYQNVDGQELELQCYGDGNAEYLGGDWNGNGTDNFAFRAGNFGSEFFMDYDFDQFPDKIQCYGSGNIEDAYLVGDWDGDGYDNLAVRRGNTLLQDFDFLAGHDVSHCYGEGNNEDQYLVGDWDGDGLDNVAVRRDECLYMDINFDHDFEIEQCYGYTTIIEPEAGASGFNNSSTALDITDLDICLVEPINFYPTM